MRALIALVASSALAMPIQARAAELFMFKSGEKSAIALSNDASRFPPSPEGWKFVISMGDHSQFMDDAGLARLSAAGFEVIENTKPSRRAADWRVLPRGTFRITKRASAQIRRYYEHLTRDGEPSVLSFGYGPVSVRDKNATEWRDLGNRITLGAFAAADVPKAVVHRHDGVPLMFQMDLKTLPSPRPTVIDYGPEGFVFGK